MVVVFVVQIYMFGQSGLVFFNFVFGSDLYVWSALLCAYTAEEPRTLLVDIDDLVESVIRIIFVISEKETLYRKINAQ